MRARAAMVGKVGMVAMVFSLAFAAACATNRKPDEVQEPVEPTQLRVENQAYLDMNIFVYRSSQRIRLGTAGGNSVTTLTIPAGLLFGPTPLRFQADPIGGTRSSVSSQVTVTAGDVVTFSIPPS